eukprot:jgi/Chrzof1/10730/Cz05g10100.t1
MTREVTSPLADQGMCPAVIARPENRTKVAFHPSIIMAGLETALHLIGWMSYIQHDPEHLSGPGFAPGSKEICVHKGLK